MKKIFLSIIALIMAGITTQAYLFFDDHQLTQKKYTFNEHVIKPIDPLLTNNYVYTHFSKEELDKALVKDVQFNNAILGMKIQGFKEIKKLEDFNYNIYTLGKDSKSYTIITNKDNFILFADINYKNTPKEIITQLENNLPKDKLMNLYDKSKYYQSDILNNDKELISVAYSFHDLESSFDFIKSFILDTEENQGTIQFTYSKKSNELNIYIKNEEPKKTTYNNMIKNISHSLLFYIE